MGWMQTWAQGQTGKQNSLLVFTTRELTHEILDFWLFLESVKSSGHGVMWPPSTGGFQAASTLHSHLPLGAQHGSKNRQREKSQVNWAGAGSPRAWWGVWERPWACPHTLGLRKGA